MFWSFVVKAASLLSHLLIWSSPSSLSMSFTFFFPLISPAPPPFFISPWKIRHTSPSHLLRSWLARFCCPFRPLFLFSSCSNLILLSVQQDKLTEEVHKQHDGPEENGSPQATQELDRGLPASAEPDASQAEEDGNKTKLLLERLKALEVRTLTHSLGLCLCCCHPLCYPSRYLASFFAFTSHHPHFALCYALWPACLPADSPCPAVSDSMTAYQILHCSSFGEQSYPMRVTMGALGCIPASVCFPLSSGISSALCR